jgi:hypothetical protein
MTKKSKRLEFSDGSYIEENKSGLIYVGVVANEVAHVMRKNNISLEIFTLAYRNLLAKSLKKA